MAKKAHDRFVWAGIIALFALFAWGGHNRSQVLQEREEACLAQGMGYEHQQEYSAGMMRYRRTVCVEQTN